MTKKERVTFISNKLEELFPNTPIPLQHSNPYTLLIAVLLSAQCTDVRVNKVTPILFKRAQTPSDMVKLRINDILDIEKIESGKIAIKKEEGDFNELVLSIYKANRLLAEKKLEAEIHKFEVGTSTSFNVLEFQKDLAAERSNELRAKVEYRKAVAQLYKAKGNTLEAGGISFESINN